MSLWVEKLDRMTFWCVFHVAIKLFFLGVS